MKKLDMTSDIVNAIARLSSNANFSKIEYKIEKCKMSEKNFKELLYFGKDKIYVFITYEESEDKSYWDSLVSVHLKIPFVENPCYLLCTRVDARVRAFTNGRKMAEDLLEPLADLGLLLCKERIISMGNKFPYYHIEEADIPTSVLSLMMNENIKYNGTKNVYTF